MKTLRPRKNSFLVRVCVCICAGYFAVTLVSLQMEIYSKKNNLAQVNQQIEEQKLKTKELERQLALGDDEAYLARIAREKLGMGFSDEHVFRDASGT